MSYCAWVEGLVNRYIYIYTPAFDLVVLQGPYQIWVTAWPIELRHILTDVPWYVDQIRCVWVPVAVSQGRLIWIPGSQHSCHACKDKHSLSLWGPSTRALTLSREARFIAWYLRCSFFGECCHGSRYFWNGRVCVGYGPAPGSHNKKAMCHTHGYMRCSTNIKDCIELEPVLFLSVNWMLVGTPRPVSVIVIIIIIILHLETELFDHLTVCRQIIKLLVLNSNTWKHLIMCE